MCGHVGIAGKLEPKDEKVLKHLLLFDYFRGPDSTGLAALRKSGEVKIAKIASNPLDLFDMNKYKLAATASASTVFLGHNRLATKGVINTTNAHPYEFDHIVGAHNGTLTQLSWRALEEAIGETFEVDSLAIIAGIAKLGIEETVKYLEGAWALVWINKADNTLNFLRNDQRPFWFAYTKELDKVLWASDWKMIHLATSDNILNSAYELYTDRYKDKAYKFFSTQADWWYRFELDKLVAGSTTKYKPKIKELKGKEPEPVTKYSYSHFHTGSPFQHGTEKTGGKTSVNEAPSTSSNVILFTQPKDTPDPFGGFMTRERFNDIAKFGCSYCGADVDYHDVGVTVWPDREQILCPDCSTAEGSNKIYVAPHKFNQVGK